MNYTNISDTALIKHGVNKEDLKTIYDNFKMYNRLVAYTRKIRLTEEERQAIETETYHCDICNKTVRKKIEYHHKRTNKHLKLKLLMDKIRDNNKA